MSSFFPPGFAFLFHRHHSRFTEIGAVPNRNSTTCDCIIGFLHRNWPSDSQLALILPPLWSAIHKYSVQLFFYFLLLGPVELFLGCSVSLTRDSFQERPIKAIERVICHPPLIFYPKYLSRRTPHQLAHLRTDSTRSDETLRAIASVSRRGSDDGPMPFV